MATPTISEVSYNYDEMFLDLARDFFKIEDISTAKTGMFGYVTGISSHIAKDAAFHRNMLYKEFFLNTASMKNTIFNWARLLDYSIDLAKPSMTQVALKLNASRLMTLPSTSSYSNAPEGTKVFLLPKDLEFIVGGKKFMLPYTVELKVWYTGVNSTGKSAYARYLTGTENTNYRDPLITTEHLKVNVDGDLITVFFNLYQLSRKSVTYDVLNNDILERSIYDIDFGSNLVSFSALYQTPDDRFANRDAWTTIDMYFGEAIAPGNTQYGYYTLTDDTTLRVYFSPKVGDFNPSFNSRVRIEMLTSEGSGGNFAYSGSVTAVNSWMDQIGYSVINLTDPTGGTDQGNFAASKVALINKLRTRDSIITEKDLELLFNVMKTTRIKKNLDTKVIKIRDDFFHRVYSVYTLLRLADNTAVPTNTVDLSVSFQEISDRNFSIKAGSVVVYDRSTSSYRLLGREEIPDPYMYNSDAYVFVVPFLANLDFKEFPKLNVYQTDYQIDVPLVYNPTNIQSGLLDTISLNNFTLQRNTLINLDRFVMSCNILGDMKALEGRKVMAKLYDEKRLVGIAPMTQVQTSGQFYLDILTSDSFTSDGRYIVENTFYEPKDIRTVIPRIELSGRYRIDVAVYDAKFQDGSSISDFTLATPVIEFNSSETIGIAEDISEYVHCPIHLNKSTGIVTIKRLPLIEAKFFFNDKYNRDINATLHQLFRILDDSDEALENNTKLDVKFFNTCGISRNYSIDTVDIRLHLQIKLRTLYSRDLDQSIRLEIAKLVEASNQTLERRFSISNMITALEKKFTDIAFIQIHTLNNSNIQTVSPIETDRMTKSVDFVPEYLCVKKLGGDDGYGNNFRYDIEIDYL